MTALNPRAVALQGVGFSPRLMALQGFVVADAPPPAFIDFGPGGWAPKSKRVRQEPEAYNLTRLHAEDREIVELLMVLVTKGFMDGYE